MRLFDFKKKQADRLHQEARQLDSEGRSEEAIAAYLQAIACDPGKRTKGARLE